MPNWCSNTLKITGSAERLRQFKAENIKEENGALIFDFDFVAPTPDNENWYNWRINNWGTKWTGDVYQIDATVFPEASPDLTIGFNTAWSPPEAWIEKASIKYPDLHFYLLYEEPGLNFGGYFIAQNGESGGECAELLTIDEETRREVEYNSDLDKYCYTDSGEAIEDEDYYPQQVNAFTY